MNGAVPNSRFYTVTPAPAFPHISYPMPTAERLPKCCQRQHALVKSSEHAETALKELCNIISLFHCSSLTHTTTHSHHLCLILMSINYYNGAREKRKLQALTPMTGKKQQHDWKPYLEVVFSDLVPHLCVVCRRGPVLVIFSKLTLWPPPRLFSSAIQRDESWKNNTQLECVSIRAWKIEVVFLSFPHHQKKPVCYSRLRLS